MSRFSTITLESSSTISRRGFCVLSAGAAVSLVSAGRGGAVAAAQSTPSATTTTTGTFLDAGFVHEIAVTFDQSAYDAVIEAYKNKGDKEWLEAAITIDGVTYEQIGMRLKGNSSLGGLRDPSGNQPQNSQSGEGEPPDDLPTPDPAQTTESGGDFVMGGPGGEISADKPESLPWLIRLDKYVDEQNHNGLTEFVIRANRMKTALNEAVALELLTEAGLASELAAPTAFSANGGERALRLAIETPNDAWMAEHFAADGLLYKSEATGDWSYRGDDPDEYKDVFDLEAGGTGDDAEDMAPLFAFLDFVNNSDDATFVEELPQRLDLERFAVYLAMMDLISNFDDINGPGNNSYLYTAGDGAQFTVVPWDMNLAFGAMGGVRIEGPMNGQPAEGGQGNGGNGPIIIQVEPGSGTPTATDGGPSFEQGDGRGTRRIGGPGGIENPLVKRFNAIADFAAMVEAQSTSLRATLYEGGVAAAILARWVDVLESGATEIVDQATIQAEADEVAAFFTATAAATATATTSDEVR